MRLLAVVPLILSASLFAQDFHQASLHLDKAGRDHQAGIIVPLVSALVAAGISTQFKQPEPAAFILGAGLVVGVSFSLSSAGHTRKAAKHLKPSELL